MNPITKQQRRPVARLVGAAKAAKELGDRPAEAVANAVPMTAAERQQRSMAKLTAAARAARELGMTKLAGTAKAVMALDTRPAKAVANAVPMTAAERQQRSMTKLTAAARAVTELGDHPAKALAQTTARTVMEKRQSRPAGRHIGPLCLALLAMAAAGHSTAQAEYRCFGDAAPAAKSTGPASVSLAYRGISRSFTKWRDGKVPVTLDHRNAPAGYSKADYEALLLSVFEELEGVADLTFDYRAIPAADGEELDDDALDEAYDSFAGIRFNWDPDRRSPYAGQGTTYPVTQGLQGAARDALENQLLAELGYVPAGSAPLTINERYFKKNIKKNPLGMRYLIMHEVLHGLGFGHSDNPLSIMHAGPYRNDEAFLHADDIAGLQAVYGPPDEFVLPEVDLGSAPAGIGLDESHSGFVFSLWTSPSSPRAVTFDQARSHPNLFHWMGDYFRTDVLSIIDRPRLEIGACVTGLNGKSPASAAVYQTSPRGEVFRYPAGTRQIATSPWECPDGTALWFPLSQYDYYAAQSGRWRFALGINGGLLLDFPLDMDVAYRTHYDSSPHGSLDIARVGDGIFDLTARLVDPSGYGFAYDWRIPGHIAFDAADPEAPHDRITGVTYIPRDLGARVEFDQPGVYEVFAEMHNARTSEGEGSGFAALARGYLAVPRESGVPSLFGADGKGAFLHIPAVDVSGTALATALEQAGADVSGGHLELLLKRTGHSGEQYKLVEVMGATAPATATASVNASGQLVLGDVAAAGGMRRSMTLTAVPGSNPLRLASGQVGAPVTGSPSAPPIEPDAPESPPPLVETLSSRRPAKWPSGEIPVAYVHSPSLYHHTEREIREDFLLPAMRLLEGLAGLKFRLTNHDLNDLEDGSFSGIMIVMYDCRYYPQLLSAARKALKKRFSETPVHQGRSYSWGTYDAELGIVRLGAGLSSECGRVAKKWNRRQLAKFFLKSLTETVSSGFPVSFTVFPPYLPEPWEIDALQTLYGPPEVFVRPADALNLLYSQPAGSAAELSVITSDDDPDYRTGFYSWRYEPPAYSRQFHYRENDNGKVEINGWWLGWFDTLQLQVAMSVKSTKETFAADDFRVYYMDPAGNVRRDTRLVTSSDSEPDIRVANGRIRAFTEKGIRGDFLAAYPGTWKAVITYQEKMLHEAELEVNLPYRPAARSNESPEVEPAVVSLGGRRFRLSVDAEDAEGDPFLVAWAGPGLGSDIQVDLNRTWRENLPAPVVLDYTDWHGGIYQVFARAVGGGGRSGFRSWRSEYVAVPFRSGVASYFPAEKVLHVPAVATDDGIWEWNLRRVGEDDPSDIRFMLLDSKRIDGTGITAVSPDSQTGLFHLDKLLGFGRGCGAARLGEIPDSEPPRLRLSACKATSNQAPTVANPVASQTARVGSRFTFTLPDGTFADPEGDELAYRYLPNQDAEWLEFAGATGTLSGTPPTTAANKDYAITVTAHDGYDDSARTTFTLSIRFNKAPVLVNSLANQRYQRARAGSPFAFTLPDGMFMDADGDTLTYSRSAPSGTSWLSLDAETGAFSGTPPTAAAGKVFTFYVTADDGHGGRARDYFTVTVGNPNSAPTVASPAADQRARASAPFSFTLPYGTFTDPDRDSLTYAHSVSPAAGWLTFAARTGAFSGTPPVAAAGTDFAVTVTAHDGWGGQVADTFILAVGAPNSAPTVANPAPDRRARAGSRVAFTLPDGTFTDADGDSLTYAHSASSDAGWLTFNAGTGAFSGTPPVAAAGKDFVIGVIADDGHGGRARDYFTVTVGNPNSAPTVARPVADQSVPAGSPVAFTLPTGTFADADGDALSYGHFASPAAPWLALDAETGAFSGTPPNAAAGMSFAVTVTAHDGWGGQAADTFTLTVPRVGGGNTVPTVANPVPDQRARAGSPVAFTLPDGTFTDADGDALTYAHSAEPDAPWLSLDAETGAFSGTPPATAAGMDFAVTVTARDRHGRQVPDTFILAVGAPNSAPTVAYPVPDQLAPTGSPVAFTLPDGTFADADGDALSYAHSASPEVPWLSLDGVTGAFSGTPPAAAAGMGFAITVTAHDGWSGQVADTFILTVPVVGGGNAVPTVANPAPNRRVRAGSPVAFTLPDDTFADADGDALTYGHSAEPDAPWLSLDAETGAFSGTPPAAAAGTDFAITVTARDRHGSQVPDTFTLAVGAPNSAPTVAKPLPDRTVRIGLPFTFTLPSGVFADADGDRLTYGYWISRESPWLSFEAATRTFSGTPPTDIPVTLAITITLYAIDGYGGRGRTSFWLSFRPFNRAPKVAHPVPDQSAQASSPFTFTLPAGTFTDADGDALTYAHSASPAAPWLSLDAGTGAFSGTPPATAAGMGFAITVTAHDGYGGQTPDTFTLTIPAVGGGNAVPTVAHPAADQRARAGSPVAFTLPDDTFTDDDGDALSYAHSTNPAAPWLSLDAGTGAFSGTPPATAAGTDFAITVTARDRHGSQVPDTFILAVGAPNSAPTVANPAADQRARASWPFRFTLPDGAFADAEGDSLTYGHSVSPAAGWLTFDAGTKAFSGTPPAAAAGTDFIIGVTADDGWDGQVADTFILAVGNPNSAPTVANPAPDQSVPAGSPVAFTLPTGTFADADGDALTYGHSASPAAPWLSLDAVTGTFSGTPPNAAAGTDFTVTVTAHDGWGGQVADTFILAIGNPNSAPTVANPAADQRARAGSRFTFTLPDDTFTDADGDALSYAHSASPAAPWLSLDAGTGAFSGTPPATAAGTDFAITVTARDQQGGRVPDTFILAVGNPNSAPTAAKSLPDQRVRIGSSFTFTLPDGIFTDADGDTLSYGHGLSRESPWLSFETATRTFSGMPPTDISPTLGITITLYATDGYGGMGRASFTLTFRPFNRAPEIAHPVPDQYAHASSPFMFTLPSGTFADADGDTLNYAHSANPEAPWLSLDAGTGAFSGTPPAAAAGVGFAVTVTARDGHGGQASDTFILTVPIADGNAAPTLAKLVPDQRALAGSPVAFALPDGTFADADGDALTYAHSTNPAAPWLSLDVATGAFSGTPPAGIGEASFTITVHADDGHGGRTRTFFRLTVRASNTAPEVTRPVPDQYMQVNSPFTYTLLHDTFGDADGDALTYAHSANPEAPWLALNAETGTFAGTPPAAAAGTDFTVTVTAHDGWGGQVADTFILTVPKAGDTNAAPAVVRPVANQRARAGSPFTFKLPDDTFADADGDALAYAHSTEPDAPWLSLDAETGAFYGMPPAGIVEARFAITVQADDGHGGRTRDFFQLTVRASNTAPEVTRPVPDQYMQANSPFTYMLSHDTFGDAEFDRLTYEHSVSPEAPWLSFDGVTGAFSGTPPATAAGTDFTVTVTAHDGWDGQVADTFILTVPMDSGGNAAPTLNFPALPNATAYVGFPFSYRVGGNVFSDRDLDALSFSAAMATGGALPAWLSFDEDSGEFRGVPAARDVHAGLVIGVTAGDGLGTSPPARFILTVAPAPAAATGTTDTDFARIDLPYVGIRLSGLELPTCMSATLSTSAGDFSFWRMSYDFYPSRGCGVPAAGHHALPVIEGHAGAMALRVPLAELASRTGRTCMAMEFALDDTDFRILRLVEVAVAECPNQDP